MDASTSGSATRAASGKGRVEVWPAWTALFTAWLFPATTARRTEGVKLRSAFLVHLIAAFDTVAVIALLMAWEGALLMARAGAHTPLSLESIWEQFLRNCDPLVMRFWQAPIVNALYLLAVVVGVEVAYFLIALLCMAWGAIDEPVRSSMRLAVQRAWLHTPHLLLVVLLCGATRVQLNSMHREACMQADRITFEPIREGSQTWTEGGQQAAWARYDELLAQQPFYVYYSEETTLIFWSMGGAWWFWSFLRFIGAPRAAAATTRVPACDLCGYNLTGIPLEGRCPECGETVASSLGPAARPGPPWEHRREIGHLRAWWRSANLAIRQPAWFGRQLRTDEPTTAHRWFLVPCLFAVFLIAWFGMVVLWTAQAGSSPLVNKSAAREIIMEDGLLGASLTSFGIVVLTLGTALLTGLVYRRTARRNLLAVSIQAACYLSGYLVACVGLAFFWMAVLFYGKNVVNRMAQEFPVARELFWLVVISIPLLPALGGYLHLVARITGAARHANR